MASGLPKSADSRLDSASYFLSGEWRLLSQMSRRNHRPSVTVVTDSIPSHDEISPLHGSGEHFGSRASLQTWASARPKPRRSLSLDFPHLGGAGLKPWRYWRPTISVDKLGSFQGTMPFKGLSGFVFGSFSNGMSNLKDLVGSFWVRFGFVF